MNHDPKTEILGAPLNAFSNLPLVTTIIPAYQHEKYVEDAIASVANQTYPNIELIVIDDGSKDSTAAAIESVLDKYRSRFKRLEFRCRPNKGLSATVSEGIAWSNGEYIQFLASDDAYEPEKTAIQVTLLQRASEAVGVFSGFWIIDGDGNVQNIESCKKTQRVDFSKVFLSGAGLLKPGSALYKSDRLKEVDLDPTNGLEDLQIFLGCLRPGGVFIVTPDLLFRYRRYEGNSSAIHNTMHLHGLAKRVLKMHSDHPLYSRVLRESYVFQFYQLSIHHKKVALSLLLRAARCWHFRKFWLGLVRLATPVAVYDVSSREIAKRNLRLQKGNSEKQLLMKDLEDRPFDKNATQ